jgi:hypothetical protein
VRIANIKYYRVVASEFIITFLAAFGLTLSIMVKETLEIQKFEGESPVEIVGFLYYNFACTILLLLAIFVRYNLVLSWKKSRQ